MAVSVQTPFWRVRALRRDSTLPVAAWESGYRAAVIGSDVLACLLVIGVLGFGVFGAIGAAHVLAFGCATLLAVLSALAACRAWHPSVLGQGQEEFGRLGRGLLWAGVSLAVAGLAFGLAALRPWVFGVMPAVAAAALPQRYLLRQVLHRARRDGRCLLPVLAAGGTSGVTDIIDRTRAAPHIGWRVHGVCTVDGSASGQDTVAGVPVIGKLTEIAEQVRRGGYRIVAVTPDPYWTPQRLRRLAWALEGTEAEMVVAPMLMEVAGPRLHVSGVLGLPLLRVSAPVFAGAPRVVKEIVDRVASAALLLLLAPLLLAVAAAVRLGDGGPVLYRQRRVGRDGRRFTMLKFRTMVVGAEARRGELAAADEGAGPLFKLRRDPRVTRVGAVLRRYSLDELPQLLNALTGSMSLVGPRPPLPEETERYDSDVRRRLLVKPGLTGLWQVSGRSDLSWDESVRLDLRYVEDWSLALDLVILWKTAHTVLRGKGAY